MKDYYKNIEGSMFDFDAFYSRMASQLPPKCRVAEIGVANGSSLCFLAEKLGDKAERIIAVDDCSYGGTHQRNVIIFHLIRGGFTNVELFEMSSLDASTKFNDQYFSFIFLDSSHTYQQTKSEILLWFRKIKYECVLAGHDYFNEENPEVKMAVDEMSIELNHVLHTEQTDKGYGIWYFVKGDLLPPPPEEKTEIELTEENIVTDDL